MNFFTKNIKMALAVILLINAFAIIAMQPAKKAEIIKGNLLVDDESRIKRNYLNKAQAEYIPVKSRKYYPFGNAFTKLPLETPFLKVIIETSDKKICTIFPATKLINCSNGSIVHLNDRNRAFHLTCDENYRLIIKEKYFPKDEKVVGFEKQFLGSMNHFNDKCIYYGTKRHQKELRENGVLTTFTQIHQPGRPPKTIYSHGPKACATEKSLVRLATNDVTKMHNKSLFGYVMGRQIRGR